ncbi:hypothetical protein [Absidia glauca]|uniref:Rap-GAP domain-containing protein n=1 Tax=Absidia glauca TaxID=4829 RepID=A0A163J9N7_ABSGL|nr:hypothetical protein [Absidia glauca]
MITTPTQQDDLPPVKFHQRLTHSFSIRTSSSTQLQRSQSVASTESRRLALPWRQQRAATAPQRKQSIMDKELPRIPSNRPSSPLDRLQHSSPTLRDFHTWISDYLSPLSRANHIISPSKLVIAKECLACFLDSVDHETFEQKIALKNQLLAIEVPPQPSFPVLAEILKSLLRILAALKPATYYQPTLIQLTDSPSTFTLEVPCLAANSDYDSSSSWPAHLVSNTHWFRDLFCGKDYTTLIVPINKAKAIHGSSASSSSSTTKYAIVTAILEPTNDTTLHDNTNSDSSLSGHCRLIIRHPKYATMRYLVPSAQVRTYLAKNDSLSPLRQQRRPSRSTFNHPHHHLISAAILSVRPEFDITKAIYLSADTTVACHLEKDLLRLDGIEIPPAYKFGILNIKDNQTKEEEWFSNTGLTEGLDRFLAMVGTRVELKGYEGYTAGLDTKMISRWKDYDIMFHVAALMPFHQNDKQQVQRKRYIGNDIVCLIFLEGSAVFDPNAIRSKFLHVYIVVRLELMEQSHRWRVEVIRKNNVPEFGPPLPNPPLFYDDQTLQKFLTVKLISAENAALKCDNFAIPNNRARAGIIEGMVEKGRAQGALPTTTTIPIDMPSVQNQQPRRPKSSSGDRFSRNSLRSIRSNPDNGTSASSLFSDTSQHGKPNDPPLPPVPSPTRSTMLQDLKKFALRRAPTLSPLQHRSVEQDPPTDDDEIPRTHYTSTPPPDHAEMSVDEPHTQRSFLAAKAKSPFFKPSTPPSPTSTSSQVPDGFRYKTQNLMINVVGRRARPSVTTISD